MFGGPFLPGVTARTCILDGGFVRVNGVGGGVGIPLLLALALSVGCTAKCPAVGRVGIRPPTGVVSLGGALGWVKSVGSLWFTVRGAYFPSVFYMGLGDAADVGKVAVGVTLRVVCKWAGGSFFFVLILFFSRCIGVFEVCVRAWL